MALSGGPDSTALLTACLELGELVVAAHFDHALRPESAAEAEHVARLCAGLGVELVTARRNRPLGGGSREAAARQARYEFLEAARASSGCEVVLLAHTADDLVESVVMNLLRGAGLAGLRGMPDRRGPYRRPLLQVWRAEIECHLAGLGITPLRDPSNSDTRYRRAWVRHVLLPSLEAGCPGIGRRFHAAAGRAAVLQEEVEDAAAALQNEPLNRLSQATASVRMETYRLLYAAAGGPRPGLARRHLEAIDRLAQARRTGASVDLPRGIRCHVDAGRLSFRTADQTAREAGPPPRLRVRQCPGCTEPGAMHLDAAVVGDAELHIRTRTPGLRMMPLGGRGRRKLQDLLVDARVPRRLRDQLPLVFAGERLVWVPGVAVESDLVAVIGRPSLHVSLDGRSNPMLESANQLRGDP